MRTKSSQLLSLEVLLFIILFLNILPATGIVITCWFGWKYKTNRFFSLASHDRAHMREQTNVIIFLPNHCLRSVRTFQYPNLHRYQCSVIINAPKKTPGPDQTLSFISDEVNWTNSSWTKFVRSLTQMSSFDWIYINQHVLSVWSTAIERVGRS